MAKKICRKYNYCPILLLVFMLMHPAYECMIVHVNSKLNSTCAEESSCSLDYYASHTPNKNNTTLLLDDGTHFLHSSIMLFEGLRNLSIIGSSSFLMSSDGTLEPATKILCIGSSGLVFSHIQEFNLCNITIVNCGRRSVSLEATAALLLSDTFNVTLYNLIVKNSTQYGMIGFNMLGPSRFSKCSFLSSGSQLGGNMLLSWSKYYDSYKASDNYILLHIDNSLFAHGMSGGGKASGLHIDYQQSYKPTFITLTNSTFIDNFGGNIAVFVQQSTLLQNSFYFQLTETIVMNGSTIDGSIAGGMSFVIQGDSPLSHYHLELRYSLFIENTNVFGSSGGLYFDIPVNGISNFTAKLSKCYFIQNTGHEGGAIGINLTSTAADLHSKNDINNAMVIVNLLSCGFEQNSASKGGAIFIDIYDSLANIDEAYQFNLYDCLLDNNTAIQGGSALFISNKLKSNKILSVNVCGTIARHNKILFFDSVAPIFAHVEATIVFEATNGRISNSNFTNNIGSVIVADHSDLTFADTVIFANNSASRGGGLQLSNSQLYLFNATYLLFKNNLANKHGGAVYIHESPLVSTDTQPACFALSINSKYSDVHPQMVFRNNKAKYGGNAIHGPAELIELCTSSNDTAHTFNIQNQPQSFESSFQTVSRELCMCDNNEPKCGAPNLTSYAVPGSAFNLQIATVNYKEEIVPSVISVKIENEDFLSNSSSIIEEFQMTQYFCTDLSYTLFSDNPIETITMSVVDYSAASPLTYLIHLLPCPIGFTILPETSLGCDCIPQLRQLGVTCHIDDKTFHFKGDVWIGISSKSGMENISSVNEKNDLFTLFSSSCPFGYCIQGFKHISLDDPDKQCSSNRSGTLCGKCSPELSISLGRAKCIECNNVYAAVIVFVFGVLGLILIAFLRIFNLTISHGSPNPVIFYANVIHVNDTLFFNNRGSDPLTVFVSWMNLDFGIESCFYDGMDALQKAWLQFVFPFYLLSIIFIIVYVSRYSSRLVRLMGKSSVSILSTLLHLVFFKLFRASVAILLYTKVHHENGDHIKVWRYDGNIEYNQSQTHMILLCLSSAVFICLIIPYILFVLCTPIIAKRGYRIGRIIFWRFMPIFDAYLAPYKYKILAQSWNGLTIVLYSILLITSTEVDTATNLLLIALSSLLLVALNCLLGGIYRTWALSVLEATLHINLICLALLSLFAILKGYTINAIVSTSVALSLVAFCGIVIYHAYHVLIKPKWYQYKSKKIIAQSDEQVEATTSIVSSIELPTLNNPYTYNYYFEERPSPKPKPVLHVDVLDQNSRTALVPRKSNLEPPTSTVIALEDLEVEEDTKEEELIRNNQTENHGITGIIKSYESVDDTQPLLSINPRNTSDSLARNSQQRVSVNDAFPLTVIHESLSSDSSIEPIFKSRRLDSDTDATGQKPSHMATKCQLIRRIDPLELEIVNEGDSECDEPVTQLKIYDFKSKMTKKHVHFTGQLQVLESKSVAIDMSDFEDRDGDNIPLLSMEATNKGITTSTDLSIESEKKALELPLISFEDDSEFLQDDIITRSYTDNDVHSDTYSATGEHCRKPAHCPSDPCNTQTNIFLSVPTIKESVRFIKMEVIPVTSKGIDYSCEEYGVSVKVSQETIPPGSVSNLEVGIAPYGPFEFPPNMMPISPIVWVCMQTKEPLSKPIAIKLPHCITELTEDDPLKQEITFLKTHHLNYTVNRDGSKVFHFQEADGWVTFPDPTCGVLHTSRFCFKCLVAKITPESAKRLGYCLIYAIPNPWPKCSVVTINIGITHFLQACIDTFKSQIRDPDYDGYDIRTKRFNFRDAFQPIRVIIQTDPMKEWIMTVQEGEEGITADDVDFWNKPHDILKMMEKNNMYPPRFVLSVCSSEAKTSSVASLQFEGTRESTKINIILQYIPQVRRQLTSDGASTRSSHSSFNHVDTIGSDLEWDDPILTQEPELHDFMNDVASKIPTKWKQLGIQLRLDMNDLERIEAGLQPGIEQCDTAFMQMFSRWKKVRPSAFAWGTLITALETPALNEKEVARELFTKLSTM